MSYIDELCKKLPSCDCYDGIKPIPAGIGFKCEECEMYFHPGDKGFDAIRAYWNYVDNPTMQKQDVDNPTMQKQVGGDHYKQTGLQPIEVIMSRNLNFQIGSIIKYIARRAYKNNAKEDLEKALHYLEFEIERLQMDAKGHILDDMHDEWELSDRLASVVSILLFESLSNHTRIERLNDAAKLLKEEIACLNSGC